MQNQINFSPITLFAQQLRSAELSQQKELKMTMQQARLLNLALTEMMDKVLQDHDKIFANLSNNSTNEVVTVFMDGGGFDNT